MSENQAPVPARPADAGNPAFREILEQIGNTKEIRQLAGNLIPELIRLWAVSGTGAGAARAAVRKRVAGLAGNSIRNALLDEQGLSAAPALPELAGDPGFARQAVAQYADFSHRLWAVVVDSAREIAGLETKDKKRLLEAMVHDLPSGKSAELITLCCQAVNDIHQDEPEFLARLLAPAFEGWIRRLDFGELKETLETGIPSVAALVAMVNTTLWEYPAKVIAASSLLPSLMNIVVDALAQTVGTFNRKGSPDLVADVLLSVLRETDTGAAARLINEASEITRKFHVGSALIGEPGSPQMPKDLAVLLTRIIDAVDGTVLWKARVAVAELKEQAGCALTDVMADHPELLADGLVAASDVHNARIRGASHRVSTLSGMDPDLITRALGRAITHLDVQEGVNILNETIRLADQLLAAQPTELGDKATSLVDALDTEAVAAFLEMAGEVAGQALMPLARAVLPHLAQGVFKALAADDDAFEDAAKTARQMLSALIKDGEGAHHG